MAADGTADSTALVIGASTTGLITAGVLARHFGQVLVLERDALPASPDWRKGAPQSRHVHLLLQRGERIAAGVYPGLLDDLKAAGGRAVDMSRDTAWFDNGGWRLRFDSGIAMHCQSKGLLEFTLRRRALALNNVTIIDRVTVDGYVVEDGRVTGVRRKDGGIHRADLVVDASGRGSPTPQILEALGFGPVPVSDLPVDVGYATRAIALPEPWTAWGSAIVHPRFPDHGTAIIMPVEGTANGQGRWLVTLVGARGAHPPADDAGFLAFAKGLAAPHIHDALCQATPLGPVALWRFVGNLRRHYERVRLPDGLVVVGDAVCSFNPIYGQGMSHGATAAEVLDACLRRRGAAPGGLRLAGLPREFHRRYARFTDQCWFISTTEEYLDDSLASRRPAWAGLANWYLRQVHQLAWSDRDAAQAFLEVMHLVKPASRLLRPGLAMRALLHSARADTARTHQGGPAHVAH
ncbi:NAD(P)/FAD-dependent oxidoreductase [Zavarzinia sp. CC-PAN008]|uniref:NAD(P)/FAD-dependent oxidoreductase n=1 Tax=Zavarzinia sp. CC-PAN008 TaxID=3243332 RepID=UPI003F74426D